MAEGIKDIHRKVASFKRKHYFNIFIRGSILTLSFILFYFLIASLLEYNLWLGKSTRFIILFSFFGLVIFCLFQFLKEPFAWWLYKRGMGDEQSAKLIGKYFPSVSDRLLNVFQLNASSQRGALLEAGISQKSESFENISFEKAIDLRENKRYLKYLALPSILVLTLIIVNGGIFTQSAKRIIQFNREFSPEAPFQFVITNLNLSAFFNEDFKLDLKLKGNSLPEAVYIISNGQRIKMEDLGTGNFSYVFENLQSEISFQFEASGFYSPPYIIHIINRPELIQLKISLSYPPYLSRKEEELINAGNLEIPEGTNVLWKLGVANTSHAIIHFSSGSENILQNIDNQIFTFNRIINNSEEYSLLLENEKSKNKDKIFYSIDVIKDQYPHITLDNLRDSILYKTILLGGAVSDDYGLTDLRLYYQITKGTRETSSKNIHIPIGHNKPQQNFFYNWSIDSLNLEPGDKLTYNLEVWDNDGVNGRKSTKSASYIFSLPSIDELKSDIRQSQQSTENKIDQGVQKAKDLRQSIDEAQQKIRGKQNLDWQDKKMLEDLVQQKNKLEKAIKDLQKENKLLEQKKEEFSEESEHIKEKSEQIQKLMDELLDDETKKLFQDLEKLLKENTDMSQIQKMLDKMDRKEINLEKELERTLELFKQLKYDYKLEQTINQLKSETEKQEKLLDKTQEIVGEKPMKQSKGSDKVKEQISDKNKNDSEKKQDNPSNEDLSEEQETLKTESDKVQKSVEELDKLGEQLNKQKDTPRDQDIKDLKDLQQNSKELLQQGKPKKSIESQKKSISKMKQMQQQLQNMQSSMEMQMDSQNIESLRQILHGLIKLSYDQENLMKDFNQIQQTDPRYIQLSQNQLKLKDDSRVLEDSLQALAKRDAFMGSVVTKEIGELNDHLDKSVFNIKERRKSNASTEMQFSMTSINNLALMLNDHFDMMMNMMANATPSSGKGKSGNQPSLSKMQQQLNQQMEQIKNGGKGGRQLSEEFARMAAEQERIRRALQEMQDKMMKEGGKMPGNDIPGKMEQTEMDLVNKQITEQTIKRQKEIITRLLEAEKSLREQKTEEERKGEIAKDYNKEIPRAFEEYLRLKKKEVELLKTMPPKLFPYYKREVNDYFNRIETKEN